MEVDHGRCVGKRRSTVVRDAADPGADRYSRVMPFRSLSAALLMLLITSGAAPAQEPGIHFDLDPDSPAQKEYAIPLDQARSYTSGRGATTNDGRRPRAAAFRGRHHASVRFAEHGGARVRGRARGRARAERRDGAQRQRFQRRNLGRRSHRPPCPRPRRAGPGVGRRTRRAREDASAERVVHAGPRA